MKPNAKTFQQKLERSTPAEEMEAMKIGLKACEMLASVGNSIVREAWNEKANRVRDILIRTRNGYRYGP